MRELQRFLFSGIIFTLSYNFATVQKLTPDPKLEKEIIVSELIHSPLPLDAQRSFETSELRKKITQSTALPFDKNLSGWTLTGIGSLQSSLQQTYSPGYSNSAISNAMHDANWAAYNRIEFYVYPDVPGARVQTQKSCFQNRLNMEYPWEKAIWPIIDIWRGTVVFPAG